MRADASVDFELLQAWRFVPNCYSLLEQSLKLLWAVRESIPPREIHKKMSDVVSKQAQQHDVCFIFDLLPRADQAIMDSAFQSMRNLHDYIQSKSLIDFLGIVGSGYTNWRYLLIEGTQKLPATHIDVMLEMTHAAVTILIDPQFAGRGFKPVETRIQECLELAISRAIVEGVPYREGSTESQLNFDQLQIQFKEVFDEEVVQICLELERQIGRPEWNPGTSSRIIELLCGYLPRNERKNLHQYFFKKTPVGRLDLSAKEAMLLNVTIFEAGQVLDRVIEQQIDVFGQNQFLRFHRAQNRLRQLSSNRLEIDHEIKTAVDYLSSLIDSDALVVDGEFVDALEKLNPQSGAVQGFGQLQH